MTETDDDDFTSGVPLTALLESADHAFVESIRHRHGRELTPSQTEMTKIDHDGKQLGDPASIARRATPKVRRFPALTDPAAEVRIGFCCADITAHMPAAATPGETVLTHRRRRRRSRSRVGARHGARLDLLRRLAHDRRPRREPGTEQLSPPRDACRRTTHNGRIKDRSRRTSR